MKRTQRAEAKWIDEFLQRGLTQKMEDALNEGRGHRGRKSELRAPSLPGRIHVLDVAMGTMIQKPGDVDFPVTV